MMAHQIPNTTMSIVLPIAFVVFMFRYSVFYALVPTALFLFNKGGNTMNLICSFVFFASIIPMEVTILKRIMGNSSESIIVDEAMESLKNIFDERPMEYKGNSKPEEFYVRYLDYAYSQKDKSTQLFLSTITYSFYNDGILAGIKYS